MGSLKWSEGGPGGVPRTLFGEMPLRQAPNYDPNVPNQPFLSTCKQGSYESNTDPNHWDGGVNRCQKRKRGRNGAVKGAV